MLTKGIVEEIITPYKAKVRLPIFDGISGTRNATESNELSEAILCSLANATNLVSIGDVVIIGFEDDDTSKPIILGHLLKESSSKTLTNLKIGSLETSGLTKLNKNTYIGNVKPSEINALIGIKSNIQGQIDNITSSLGSGDVETNNIIVGESKALSESGTLSVRETLSDYPILRLSANAGYDESYINTAYFATKTILPRTKGIGTNYDIGLSNRRYDNCYVSNLYAYNINGYNVTNTFDRTVYQFAFDFNHSQTVDTNGAYLIDSNGNTTHTVYSHGRPMIISGTIEGYQNTGGNAYIYLYVDGKRQSAYVTSSANHKHTFGLNFILSNLSVGEHTISFLANTNVYTATFNSSAVTQVTIFEV